MIIIIKVNNKSIFVVLLLFLGSLDHGGAARCSKASIHCAKERLQEKELGAHVTLLNDLFKFLYDYVLVGDGLFEEGSINGLDILGDLIFNLFHTSSIVHRVFGLALVIDRGRYIHKHEGLGTTTQGVLHNLCQGMVSIGNVVVTLGQGRDHVAEGT